MDIFNYSDTDYSAILYKDFFVIYMNLIKSKLRDNNIDEKIVRLIDADTINVNRAPLIILKRTHSPQPPTGALLNERLNTINNKNIINSVSYQMFNLLITCYGNTYLESERLASLVIESIILSSINKIRALSENRIIGHEFLNWSETGLVSQDTKLFASSIEIRISTMFETSTVL